MHNILNIPYLRQKMVFTFFGNVQMIAVEKDQYAELVNRVMTEGKPNYVELGDEESGPLGLDYFGHNLEISDMNYNAHQDQSSVLTMGIEISEIVPETEEEYNKWVQKRKPMMDGDTRIDSFLIISEDQFDAKIKEFSEPCF